MLPINVKGALNAVLLGTIVAAFSLPAAAADLMSFWDTQQKGANSFNKTPPDEAYFKALAATGATC